MDNDFNFSVFSGSRISICNFFVYEKQNNNRYVELYNLIYECFFAKA